MGALVNEEGTLVREKAEKAELLNAFFASVFTGKTSGISGTGDQGKGILEGRPSLVQGVLVREQPGKHNITGLLA